MELAASRPASETIHVNLSGRGDKDVDFERRGNQALCGWLQGRQCHSPSYVPIGKGIPRGCAERENQVANHGLAAVDCFDQPAQAISIEFVPLLGNSSGNSPDAVYVHFFRGL
jgi:hypothetical protein